ncbi:MAG: hypothetical protein IJI84_06030 [Clostridia bacterium]|nr:hypothetical protein [Clostridia bacterium]
MVGNISVTHDELLTISTGSSRKTKIWKSKKISWGKFIQRLSNTKRTNETQAQYFRLGKERQDEIKDVGGFVGGELKDGRRTALNVINRQLITLDADFAEKNLWEKIQSDFDNAACVYSTHKHTKENPRLRIIIPLDRPVSPDEYQAISRKIAESFGIDNFDDTTYQPHRLMYFPSTSSDAEFYFQWQDGEFLSADSILAEYDDWQDVSTWPRSTRSKEIVQHEIKKAEDPLKKSGLIGAFCRSYTIQEVIEKYLPDVYEEINENRFTFRAGTSAGGAIVFENKFLYSFHATDPCSLILCNAFDLVRIHKFGELDEGKEKKEIVSLPSYTKMLDLCSKDEKVKILLTEEALKDFDDLGEEKQDMSWSAKLERHPKTGKILATRDNIRTILENDSRLKNKFGYDLFSQRIVILQPLFWRSKDDPSEYWTDGDDSQLRYYLETYYNIDNKAKTDDEILNVANNHAFHKVKDYLRGLKWDGKPRMDKIFITYLGATDDNYVRIVTRKSLIAAVARIMKPGIKFDNMIVLEGAQGIGKSYLLSKLGKDWFSDSLSDLKNKDAYESLRGYWILELGEMLILKKTDSDTAKHFISKQVDSFRVSFGKRTSDFPRQCIFFGTTNNKFFLKDKTGNRRFFPITCSYEKRIKNIFLDEKNIDSEIDQIWAEAYEAWKTGESIWIGHEMEQVAKKIQELHTEENPLVGAIEEYLNKEIPKNWYERNLQRRIEYIRGIGDFDEEVQETFKRDKVCATEIWCELLGGDMKKLSPYEIHNITDSLLSLSDWEPSTEKLFFGSAYGRQKAFVRKKVEDDDDLPF